MGPIVLLLPKTSYNAGDFLAAAERLGVEVIPVSDMCHQLADHWEATPLAVRFREAEGAAEEIVAAVRGRAPAAVLGVDDLTAFVASLTARALGLPHNAPEATGAARNKLESRRRFAAAGLPVPRFAVVERGQTPGVPFPCVVKPLVLSGSRGVIRADDPAGLSEALDRVFRLLRSPEVAERRDPELGRVLVEEFIPGPEVALEGLLRGGALHVLALFDKPDPLDGPFFEETLYVTPSRHPPALQLSIATSVSRAAAALGLSDGPIHAELRLAPEGPFLLEVAARSIGGLCGRTLRFGVGVTLAELILRHALGLTLEPPARERSAAGVLMLPIRKGGILRDVAGLDAARQVPLIEDVVITAHTGEELVPLPEGGSYLGFAFARGATPESVEAALRAAGAAIDVRVQPKLHTTRAP